MMITPETINHTVIQGATWTENIVWALDNAPVDLTNYTAKMQIRSGPAETRSPVVLELTESSGITLGSDGSIALIATSEQTAAIDSGDYVYDLLIQGTEAGYLCAGRFTIEPRITV